MPDACFFNPELKKRVDEIQTVDKNQIGEKRKLCSPAQQPINKKLKSEENTLNCIVNQESILVEETCCANKVATTSIVPLLLVQDWRSTACKCKNVQQLFLSDIGLRAFSVSMFFSRTRLTLF